MSRNYQKELTACLAKDFHVLKDDLLRELDADCNHENSTGSRKWKVQAMYDAVAVLDVTESEAKKKLIDVLVMYHEAYGGVVVAMVNKQIASAPKPDKQIAKTSNYDSAGFHMGVLKQSLLAFITVYKDALGARSVDPLTSEDVRASLSTAMQALKNLEITLVSLEGNKAEDHRKIAQLALHFCEQGYGGNKGTRAIFIEQGPGGSDKEARYNRFKTIEPYDADFVESIMYKPPASQAARLFRPASPSSDDEGPPTRQNTGTPSSEEFKNQ
jgi:hypothetical protein